MGTHGSEHSNGAVRMHAGLSSLAHAGGVYDDPMNKVLGLDAKTSTFGAWFGFTSGGTLLIVAGMALALAVAWWHRVHDVIVSDTSQEIEVEKEQPPPPPPAPPPPEPEEVKPAAPPPHAMPREAPPPPPAPAQAAKVLTQEPKQDEPVDLTGNTIVTGNADAYAGGFTSGNGTSKQAVNAMPSPTGVPGGTGPVNAPVQQAAPKVDRSRPVAIGSTEWNCPFPAEADTAQVDEAYVTLQVDVRPDGTIAAARVLSDPGNGFGREARRCALSKRLSPALDVDGNPIASTSKPFRVHFSR